MWVASWFATRNFFGARTDVVEANQVDILAAAVFCDFEQVKDPEETGFAGQFRSDVRKSDWLDGVDFDRSFFHTVALADGDARRHPDADGAGDFAAADAFPEAFGEDHRGYGSTRRRARS